MVSIEEKARGQYWDELQRLHHIIGKIDQIAHENAVKAHSLNVSGLATGYRQINMLAVEAMTGKKVGSEYA